MKISENWLRSWVNPQINTQELIQVLTMAGLEVDGVEALGESLADILVGQIDNAEPHPQADRLQLCSVNIGATENLQIICGAPNARAGIKVAVAPVGSVLPGDFKIKKAKLRGVDSFGMLCSARELQLGEDSDGIIELADDAVIGSQLIQHLSIKDNAIDIDLTPNRGDCLSIKGIAKEVATLTQTALTPIVIKPAKVSIKDKVTVKLSEPKANPRFVARVIKGVDIKQPTPEWMKARLAASDIRSIDAVVDITNYVMLELGHPMHAFDLNHLQGGIEVRYAKPKEKLLMLDGQEIELREDTLVVADKEKVLSMAGIMGGRYSGISEQTTDLLLEVAHWDPVDIAGKARSYAMHTDASHRFERGVDYQLCIDAMQRATQLMLEIVAGQAGPMVDQVSQQHLPQTANINLYANNIEKLLGINLSSEQVEDILGRLGMQLSRIADGWKVTVPSARFDISLEADLIEELVRVYGYNQVPSNLPVGQMSMIRQPESRLSKMHIAELLVDRGYQEAITYSFVDQASQQLIDPQIPALQLINPISSELAVMRTSLWPGLLKVVEYNQKRQAGSVQLFESGLKFIQQQDKLSQIPVIAGVIAGQLFAQHWEGNSRDVDFYDLKGDLQAVFNLTAQSEAFQFTATTHQALHPRQTALISRDNQNCGIIGRLHPKLEKAFDVDGPVYLFELELAQLASRRMPEFSSLSKFPSIRRDIAILVKENVTSSQIIDLIGQTAKNWLNNISIFDIYRGKGIEKGYKSMAIAVSLQRFDRTFKEHEINQVIQKVVDKLSSELGAVLRD